MSRLLGLFGDLFPPRPCVGGFYPLQVSTPYISKEAHKGQNNRRLREDWPFLNNPDCPPELQILVSKKITAYHTYVDAHKKLFDCTNLDEQFETVKQLTEAFIENQAIFRELNHYKQHNRPLGEHPLFEEYQKIKALRTLSPVEAFKKQEKLKHNIWRLESQLNNPKQQHLRISREKLIEEKRSQLAEIDRLINL